MDKSDYSYWRWFLWPRCGKSGIRKLGDGWLLLHALIGVILGLLVTDSMEKVANSVLLPMVGLLIGLTFAWGGNAFAVLQSREIARMSKHREGGLRTYVFTYQTAILSVLTSLVLWGIAGLGIFDQRWPTPARQMVYLAMKIVLFAMLSFSVRECWHVVLGSQWLLLAQHDIIEADRKDRSG